MAEAHPSQNSVTELLVETRNGNRTAVGKLFERVYGELRRIAHRQRRRWHGDSTLQTTALVSEAYLKLIDQGEQSWSSRSHFFAVAAQAMRYILINEARRKGAQKRGGEAPTLSLEELREVLGRNVAMTAVKAEALVVLEEALEQFECEDERAARVVECRFFGGMTIEETAEALGVSASTVSRDWAAAKAWLCREVKGILEED